MLRLALTLARQPQCGHREVSTGRVRLFPWRLRRESVRNMRLVQTGRGCSRSDNNARNCRVKSIWGEKKQDLLNLRKET